MKRFSAIFGSIGLLMLLCFFAGCSGGGAGGERPAGLIIDTLLPTTPVKNQGSSPLCWIYSALAVMETEHLAQGDSVNLSAIYVARMFLHERGMQVFGAQGSQATGSSKTSAQQRNISLRGTLPMCLQLTERYGLQPYDYYEGSTLLPANGSAAQPNLNVVARKVEHLVRMCRAHRMSRSAFEEKLDNLLDQATGFMPRYVHMLGATYSSREFAHSVCRPGEYIVLTTMPHQPYYQWVDPRLPDNQMGDRFLNVPADSLMRYVVRALRGGHPVGWEGGLGNTPSDDHCMAIVGLAHTRQPLRRYFVCKNSWGTNRGDGGFCYLSYEHVQQNTIAVMLPSQLLQR